MRKISILLALALVLTGCAVNDQPQRYTVTYLDLFDTVTTITGTAASQAEFEETCQVIYEQLQYYHQLFDIYHEYEGVNNLMTVNKNAGVAPVEVEQAVIDFLLDCKEYYTLTSGKVNVAMGSVLSLWHEARENALQDPENAALPDEEALADAAGHMSLETVIIDQEASTVFISDGLVQLDVGAVVKGWAAQQVAKNAPSGLLISLGGNVCATGPKQEPDTPWVVGVQDPAGESYLQKIQITGGSVVTSGDYQRYFEVEGQRYHHIIDPDTLMPSAYWQSVTVVCPDSALADALSTALFLLPLEEGKALAKAAGTEAMWLDMEGNLFYSDNFEALICN